MANNASLEEYPFPWPDQDKGYSLFPPELENDELIAFHGTAQANLQSIIKDGFKFGESLKSISFAKQSSLALRYGSEARTKVSPKGCVLAVRFTEPIPRPGVGVETSIIYVYKPEEQPKVVGYCIIPENYQFV
jgi:hypothetical protein